MKQICLFFTCVCVAFAFAQDVEIQQSSIFRSFANPDSLSGATLKIFQDTHIDKALMDRKSNKNTQGGSGVGYRIQVFSSNVQRTAKADAFKIEKEIRDFFPETPVYVSYTSPFWKVRIGDFKTMAEAQNFRSEFVKLMPDLKNETYTVKDKVNY
ncbi:MAG: hypothetical protein AUK44_02120 [Porphyromonadaceae bacterium CG2_30_38_12]|nr:MAG: hypothetical protein AUK44_02120 [Porphyromonadaceae bacterium CG2_30_38_12]